MSVTGYIVGTVAKPVGALAGNVSITGAVAATVVKPTGGLSGSVSATGSIAATVRKPTGNLIGGFPITGSIAATVAKPVGGCNPVNISFRFKSRPIHYSIEEKNKFAELLFAVIYCNFNDTLDYDITLFTDNERYSAVISYDDNEVVINAQSSAGRPYFRQFIQAVPPEGAFGSFFQIEIEKQVHHLNGFKFTGLDMYSVSRPGIMPEFIAGDATLEDGWG